MSSKQEGETKTLTLYNPEFITQRAHDNIPFLPRWLELLCHNCVV